MVAGPLLTTNSGGKVTLSDLAIIRSETVLRNCIRSIDKKSQVIIESKSKTKIKNNNLFTDFFIYQMSLVRNACNLMCVLPPSRLCPLHAI